jgi:hypothetical protein
MVIGGIRRRVHRPNVADRRRRCRGRQMLPLPGQFRQHSTQNCRRRRSTATALIDPLLTSAARLCAHELPDNLVTLLEAVSHGAVHPPATPQHPRHCLSVLDDNGAVAQCNKLLSQPLIRSPYIQAARAAVLKRAVLKRAQ